MARCKGCNAEIVYVKTTAGKFMPCEIKKRTSDTLKPTQILVSGEGEVFSVRALEPDEVIEGYEPHWGNCPARKRFSKKVL